MPPIASDRRAWLRRLVPWSNSPESWRERIGLAGWLVTVVLWWLWFRAGGYVFGPQHLAAVAGLVLSLAYLARRGWLRLFGPVLFYDILRNARRGRFVLVRWLYAVGLLLLLLWVYQMWDLERRFDPTAGPVDYKMQAKLAEQYFIAFAITQFIVVVALTPAYVAGAIAEEKERKTLEFLLATDLHNREIVLGKFVARVGNLALFVLTGLPILSLMQFFGGIDPGLLLASFAITGITALSLASLSIVNSVLRRRVRDAILITYLAALGYIAVASASLALPPVIGAYRREMGVFAPYAWENVLDTLITWFNYGNPFVGLFEVIRAIESGLIGGSLGSLSDLLVDIIDRYIRFHGIAALVCVTWAVLRLRRVALTETAVVARSRVKNILARRRPPVSDRPVFWKEVRVEGGLRFGWMGRILIGLLAGGTFVPIVIMFYVKFFDAQNRFHYSSAKWTDFGQEVNAWLRAVNVVVSVLMLLGVAVRAAGLIGGERDRDTLTSLMGTTLTTQEIMWGKWWGSLLSVRLFLVWLCVAWAIGLVSGGVNVLAVVLQTLAWVTPATFLASVGLYFSAACKTTLRATTWTLLTAIIALGGHWLIVGMCCYLPLNIIASSDSEMKYPIYLQTALTPPAVFVWTPFREMNDLTTNMYGDGFPGFAVLGMFLWCVAAAVVGNAAHERFQRLTHRTSWVQKPMPEPAAKSVPEPPAVGERPS